MSGLIPYSHRNLPVDFLRGVSILLVLLLHDRIGGAEYSRLVVVPSWVINPLAYNGALGVCQFFVISGYLITAMVLQRDREIGRIRLGRFYLFRASRILPPLASVIAVNLACGRLGIAGFGCGDVGLGRVLASLFTFRFNLLYLRGALSLPAWSMLWSLSIEESFYLVFPLAARALRAEWLLVLVLAAVAVQGPWYREAHGWSAFYSYRGCFDQLAIGCLVALLSRRWRASSWRPGVRHGLQALGLALFFALCYRYYIGTAPNWVFLPSAVAGAAAMFLLGSPMDPAPRPPGTPWTGCAKPLCLAGFLSYELYLFYAPFLLLLQRPLHEVVTATGGFMPRDLAVPVLIGAAMLVCGLLHTWVHEPLQRWIRDLVLTAGGTDLRSGSGHGRFHLPAGFPRPRRGTLIQSSPPSGQVLQANQAKPDRQPKYPFRIVLFEWLGFRPGPLAIKGLENTCRGLRWWHCARVPPPRFTANPQLQPR